MQPRPRVIVFDVNETLSDMAPMARRFADVGAPDMLATVWFAALLRDGFALAAAGGMEPFARLARGALETVLAGASLNRPAGEAADHILSGFSDLSVHLDVPGGVRLLRDGGLRLVTLSNGSADVAGRLLDKAGIHGARRAGMRTGWITRQPAPYPGYFSPPDLQASDLGTLARQILA